MPQGQSAGFFIRWLLLFAALWAVISGAEGWAFGVPASLAAATLAWRLPLPWPSLRWRHLPAFIAFFLRELTLGAWDVARRILHPRVPIDPAWHTYSLHSHNPRVHLMLSALVGLLPGTMASHFDNGILHLHILDSRQPWSSTVARLEWHLERLLGERL
ncbi:Na+/H+ antiporter subunit E [Marinimicrobium sp. ARAG 43.8]|uniref:Na+/H+ antiporter subunit E n=1 Tax=Marinimicrobium sp. ARAG 43.8 TaxID=3418719 RepID=UPI003CFAEE13